MKVLQLINTLSVGGAELHLLTLCRYLKKQNVEIVVACLREQVNSSRSLRVDFEKERIKVITLNADSRYDYRFFGKIARILTEECPDVFHTHLPRADLAGAFARFLNPSIVWVSSVHAIYSEDWSGRWSLPLIRCLWRTADAIVCISHAVRDWLIQKSIPPQKTTVIHYGIETEQFSRSQVPPSEEWNGGGQGVEFLTALNGHSLIGSIGRLEPRKNHECLIAAMPEVCKRVPNAVLLIAGHDPWGYGTKLHQQIERLGLQQRVRLIGFQTDVVAFLSGVDVFAFASNSEGFGQVLVEAMAARKPVVASKIPPFSEIVVDGETGLLVERGNSRSFADALSRLLLDPENRERMGRMGQIRVQQHFTADKMTDATLSLYSQLIRKKSCKIPLTRNTSLDCSASSRDERRRKG